MQRYFLDEHNQIQKEDIHHIKNVMRMKSNDEVELCDATGACFIAKLIVDNTQVSFEKITSVETVHKTNSITLIQGIGKGDKNEFVVKYATQFGADTIMFVEMTRSISKMDTQTWDKKKDRYEKIAMESARLSHRNTVPNVVFVQSLKQLNTPFDHAFVAYENDRETTFLDKIHEIKPKESIALLIGPEGGIDELEMALLKDKGFVSVGLGNRILQTEVAGLYGLSLIDGILETKR
jgi:16S rRNA (uracil1498-N3)-methyltransferase